MEGGDPKVIPNEEGARTTPSVVAFTSEGQRLVGQIARRQAITNPQNTVFSIKRFIGRRFDEVPEERKLVPYTLKSGANKLAVVDCAGTEYSPPEIAAMVLQKLKAAAEAYLGETVTQAVVTVPAYFNDAQRQATKDAGTVAGLEVLRLVNEPTAASLAYSMDRAQDEKIAVFDLGGGTFDISILEVSDDDGESMVQVLASNGDGHLGGDDFDERIIRYLIDEFKKDQGIDLAVDPMAMQRLKEAAEKAKIELSSVTETEINLPYVTADQSGPKHMNLRLSRAKFEHLVDDLIERTRGPVEQVCKDAGISPRDIDEVILVGGSTRIPKVQEFVESFFGKEPNRSVNPDEVVAIGAAIQAGILAGDVKDVVLLDVTPLSLGIETLGNVTTKLIERNTTIPAKRSQVFSTAAPNQPQVEIHVLQGEREMSADNRSLGRFILDGIPPAPRGIPQIEVTFDIDANGILSVHAADKASGKEQSIRIEESSGLDEGEIEKMVKDAESHASEDKSRRERVDLHNSLDSMAYEAQKTVDEHREKVPVSDLSALESAIEATKPVLENSEATLEELQQQSEQLQAALHKVSEALYKSEAENADAGNAEEGDAGSADASGDEEVVDAEFTEEK